uniref:Core shell protein Gag P30 domain-containing protein n=1 Tax=Zonotrichia albicollis TaxID=44394 RepID=A0A8D2M3U7_ZONAL
MEKLKGILGSNTPIPQISPLGCLLAHWKQDNFGEELCKTTLIDYCNSWWPEYALEHSEKWPKYGTLQYNTILQLMSFCKQEGKWDEVPYVDLFFYLRGKPEWQDECGLLVVKTSAKCGVCEERCLEHLALKEILSRENYTDTDLQVAPIGTREPNSIPPISPVSSVPIPLPAPHPTSPEPVSSSTPFPLYPPLPSSPNPSSSEDEQNVTVIERRKRYASEKDSNGNESGTPIAHRTRSQSKLAPVVDRKGISKQKRTVIAPLRQEVGVEGPVFAKVPFLPADLVIWKQSAGTYRENPDKMAQVVKMVMKTQNPDWDNIQVILDTLMDSTEKEMVLKAAKREGKRRY